MSERIAIVDDDQDWREAAAELLRYEGFEVETAANGIEGLRLLEESSPQLVILDVHLPRLNGIEVLEAMEQQSCRVPVLLVSGEECSALIAQAMRHGAATFLRKPIPPELLLSVVRRGADTSFEHTPESAETTPA